VVQAPAGHDFLAPALTASYRFNGQATTLVISLAADAGEAERRVEQLHATINGRAVKRSFSRAGAWQCFVSMRRRTRPAFLDKVKP